MLLLLLRLLLRWQLLQLQLQLLGRLGAQCRAQGLL
jgi:hypothetical protein